MECNRSHHVSAEALERLHESMWQWMVDRDYVVATEEAMQSLELSFVEALQQVLELSRVLAVGSLLTHYWLTIGGTANWRGFW